jgi:hypothetical protein
MSDQSTPSISPAVSNATAADAKRDRDRLVSIHNERLKLTANYVNAIAGTLFAVGGVGSIITATTVAVPAAIGPLIAAGVICMGLSGSLHMLAVKSLGDLTS